MITATWLDAIDDYIIHLRNSGARETTLSARRQHLQHLARRIGCEPWEVTGRMLSQWAGRQSWMPETRRGRRQSYLGFWEWAISEDYTADNPALALPRVHGSEPDPRPVPDHVYHTALGHADARERVMLQLAADHGLRRGEVAVVHSRDVTEDLLGWSLLVHGKGGKARTVPLTPRLAYELRQLGSGWAFPGDDGGHLSPRWVGKLVTTLLDGDWTMHKLRHRAATRVHLASGGDLLITQRLLGHASPATTQRYVRVEDEAVRRAVMTASGSVRASLTRQSAHERYR